MKGLDRVNALEIKREAIEEEMLKFLDESVKDLSELAKCVVKSTAMQAGILYFETAVPEIIEAYSKGEDLRAIEQKYEMIRKFDYNARNEFDWVTTEKIKANAPAAPRSTRSSRRRRRGE